VLENITNHELKETNSGNNYVIYSFDYSDPIVLTFIPSFHNVYMSSLFIGNKKQIEVTFRKTVNS
jgi:hypothetical protein